MPTSKLIPPPRPLPMSLRLKVLFGRLPAIFGWFFLAFGMVFVWVFAPATDFASYSDFRGSLETAPARIIDSRRTSYSTGSKSSKRPIYAFDYQFTHGGGTHSGTSYQTGKGPAAGVSVTVEFPKGRPQRSRIQGMRTSPMDAWVLLFVPIFPLIGAGLVVVTLRGGLRITRLLQLGHASEAMVFECSPTNTTVNGRRVFAYGLSYRDSLGNPQTLKVRTSNEAMMKEGSKTALSDERGRAVLLEQWLPTGVDESGGLKPAPLGQAILVTLLPAATIIGHGTWALIFMR